MHGIRESPRPTLRFPNLLVSRSFNPRNMKPAACRRQKKGKGRLALKLSLNPHPSYTISFSAGGSSKLPETNDYETNPTSKDQQEIPGKTLTQTHHSILPFFFPRVNCGCQITPFHYCHGRVLRTANQESLQRYLIRFFFFFQWPNVLVWSCCQLTLSRNLALSAFNYYFYHRFLYFPTGKK